MNLFEQLMKFCYIIGEISAGILNKAFSAAMTLLINILNSFIQ